jgi:predicted transcriptional regulator
MLTELTVSIVAAFVQHQRIEAGAIPDLIVAVHRTLGDIRAAGVLTSDPDVPPQAAVSVRKSLADPEWIVSMIDGKRYRMLKRHIGMHGLTPDAYRARYRLPSSYPMVAPAYAAYRRALAKKSGLAAGR